MMPVSVVVVPAAGSLVERLDDGLLGVRGLQQARPEDARQRQPQHDQPHQHGDEETQAQPGDGHHQRGRRRHVRAEGDDGPLERLPRAQGRHRVHDRRGEHVGERAGDGQALFHQPPDHRHHRAFADRQQDSQQARRQHRRHGPPGQQPVDRALRQVDVDEAADQRSEQDERSPLEEDAEESESEVLSGVRRHGGELRHGNPALQAADFARGKTEGGTRGSSRAPESRANGLVTGSTPQDCRPSGRACSGTRHRPKIPLAGPSSANLMNRSPNRSGYPPFTPGAGTLS